MQCDRRAEPAAPHADQMRRVRLQLEGPPSGLRQLHGPRPEGRRPSASRQRDAGHRSLQQDTTKSECESLSLTGSSRNCDGQTDVSNSD